MRSKTRNETPKPGTYATRRDPKKRKEDAVATINSYNTVKTEREKALDALAMMKELERKRRKGMTEVRIDPRTVVCVKKGREKEIKELIKARKI